MNRPLRIAFALSLYGIGLALGACSGDDGSKSGASGNSSTVKGGTTCTPNQTVFCRCGPEAGNAAGEDGYVHGPMIPEPPRPWPCA